MSFDPLLGNISVFYELLYSIQEYIKKFVNHSYTLHDIFYHTSDYTFDDELLTEYVKFIYVNLISKGHIDMYKIFDNNNNEILFNQIQLNYNYKAIICIDSIWIDVSKKKYGLNINLIQLKMYKPIYQSDCLIDNIKKNVINPLINPLINPIINEVINDYIPKNDKIKKNDPPNEKISIKPFVPNINDLLSIKLKKTV
jgi:hypothetical protein